ncbi:heme biosynthesis HemY N-terminal domain-containing protein [Luteimonas sp. MC1828]|uniref:heme biosynthesis HemY N-terminal domain-containing protein n=1 Tax=Luteimonas sp. MC1828 TaxID=2799787 RepID=UPI0018F13F3E|nr:heme biosynthesis HemY N-terminal domain-containing protein [Luteimonas sp. MC1828]MBJ7575358.1 heme biosynthesis protein HemY [Luteimonas sp. MC1828]
MNLFRNLLLWILLAIVGALAWHLLAQDPGYVLVRYRGWDYTTNLLWVGVAAVVALFVLWLLWALIALPLRAWRQRRDQQSRARLGTGLEALYHGHYARAEKLLPQAGDDSDAAVALLASSRAALARGDHDAARRHLDAIDVRHALTRAIGHAELSLAEERPTDALVALDAPAAQPLSPRGLALRAEALAVSGQAAEAYALLGALRQQQALPDAVLAERELRWAAAAIQQEPDANVLADRWESLPKPLRAEPTIVAAYAERAAALGWDEAATSSIEQALATRWDERLAARYGSLPLARHAERRATAERWLQQHPGSPALLLTLARLARLQDQPQPAMDYLQRALAQGAGGEGWEELGHNYAQLGDDARARAAYGNALRAMRGEPVVVIE